MSERTGMSLLLRNQALRVESIATALQHAVDGNKRAKLTKELLQIAEEMESLSDSAIPVDDDDDGIDLDELRRHTLPDGTVQSFVAPASKKGGE
jgi:hypothetical protein